MICLADAYLYWKRRSKARPYRFHKLANSVSMVLIHIFYDEVGLNSAVVSYEMFAVYISYTLSFWNNYANSHRIFATRRRRVE